MTSPIQIKCQRTKRGIYETFDFRGLSADARYAFVLKHTIFKPWLGKGSVTLAVFCFDRKTAKSYSFSEQEELSVAHEKQFKQADDWDNCSFGFASGSFFDINRHILRGKIHNHQGTMSWNLQLQRQDEGLHPLPPSICFELPWPRHKVQVRDCFITYYGKIQCGHLLLSGAFAGSNHHYWGDGYPVEYASAQTHHFIEEKDAFFYGFSARLRIGRLFNTPYLSMASLKLRGHWYNFNQSLESVRHHVEALDNYRWRMTFLNNDYGLDVDVDGANPRIQAWVAWHAEQPLSGRSVVKMTPFAKGSVTLYRRSTMELIAELTTQDMELKTLLPENTADSMTFAAIP